MSGGLIATCLIACGVLSLFFGSSGLNFLVVGLQTVIIGVTLVNLCFHPFGAAALSPFETFEQEGFAGFMLPGYLPVVVAAFGLGQLMTAPINALAAAACFGVHIFHLLAVIAPAVEFASFVSVTAAVSAILFLVLEVAAVCTRFTPALLQLLNSTLFGALLISMAITFLASANPDCAYTLLRQPNSQCEGVIVDVFAGSLALMIIGIFAQCRSVGHKALFRSFQPRVDPSASNVTVEDPRAILVLTQGGTAASPPPSPMSPSSQIRYAADVAQIAVGARTGARLSIDPLHTVRQTFHANGRASMIELMDTVRSGEGGAGDGLPDVPSTAEALCAALGLQPSVVETQTQHLQSLLKHAQRGGASAAEAARQVHNELLSSYAHWCLHHKLRPLSDGAVADCLMYLVLWNEAANLRHMPELLCWLYHSLRSAMIQAEDGEPVCANLLVECLQPIYSTVAKRLSPSSSATAEKLTYDDLNEFFWTTPCLQNLSAFANAEEPTIITALSSCQKTHRERLSWMHTLVNFGHTLVFVLECTTLLILIGMSLAAGDPFIIGFAKATSVMYLEFLWMTFSGMRAARLKHPCFSWASMCAAQHVSVSISCGRTP